MKIFKKRRGYWPMGERFAAFFRGPTIPQDKVQLKIRDNRPLNVSPTGRTLEIRPMFSAPFQSREYLLEEAAWMGRQIEAARRKAAGMLACGDFVADSTLPDYCAGCTQPKGAHSYESLVGADFSAIEARVVAHMAQEYTGPHTFGCHRAPGECKGECVSGKREVIEAIPFKELSPELMNTLRDIERAREDFWKLTGVNDYFKCEKPT